MVDDLTIRINHEAAEIKIDIFSGFAESEKSAACHESAPVATDAEVGKLCTVAFFKINSLSFFKINGTG